MEPTFGAAYIMGATFLVASAGLTVGMFAYSIWKMIKGEGLSGASVSIAGVGIEGVDIVSAGELSNPANANAKRSAKSSKAA